jgi:hypothetical protein
LGSTRYLKEEKNVKNASFQLVSSCQLTNLTKKIDVFTAKTVRTPRKLRKEFRESAWFVTVSLISEFFSFWLKSPEIGAKSLS